ncbi:MAG: helix-turn-helix transcriptional regulator [Mesorhizobium sp.]|uniref:XRE family transcriptional regulator n=1 Tax=Mesorhizobium sp. TaxID=1871066 RepID=UPI000FE92565|nr:helix-turn-helix transcriptional regulator [Mesorhizobium sp.]RWC29816.1 MAG: helix-turn-helix transcriptional regulator [Mesorhizobium sp.]
MISVAPFVIVAPMETMGDRLRAARERAGYRSAAKAAEALGISPSTFRAHENGQNEFGPVEAERYARRFGTTAAHLLTGSTATVERLPSVERDSLPKPNASFPPRYEQFPQLGSIPVLGQSVGGPNGRFVLNGQEAGRVFCPPMLENVEGAYAVRVYGTSMEPRYFAGETIWINPHEPVRSGDFVVVQVVGEDDDESRDSYIKQFVSRSNSLVRLRQLNPDEGESETLDFPTKRVFSVHKIVFQASL